MPELKSGQNDNRNRKEKDNRKVTASYIMLLKVIKFNAVLLKNEGGGEEQRQK